MTTVMKNQFVWMSSSIRTECAFIEIIGMNIHMNDQFCRVTERRVAVFPRTHLFFWFVSLITTTVEHSFMLFQDVITVANKLAAFNQTGTNIGPAVF